MNIDTVRHLAPAAFAVSPDASLSDSYSHVTTANVLDALQQDGWTITDARQPRTRTGSVDHKKHEISLTHRDLPTHAEGSPLLRLSNSSDGGHAFRLIGGFLRAACTNQLYTGIKVVGGVFHHRGGGLEERIVAGAREARANFDRVISTVDLWRQIELNPEQRRDIAIAAVAARWPGGAGAPVFADYHGMLRPRRWGDEGRDLWSTFNRAQEAVMRGGFEASFARFNDEGERIPGLNTRYVRKVTSLTATQRINTQLWDHAALVAGSITV
jgi:hypothetical protein